MLSLRLLHIQVHPEIGFKSHITPTHFRIDSLFAGVVLSYFINNHSVSSVATITRWRRTLLLMGCVLLSVNAFFELESSAFAVTYGFTANYIGAAAIVAVMGTQQLPRNSITLSIGRIGEYSYGVYLWHFPVLVWCGKALSAESHFNTDYSFQWSVFWLFLYILASLLCGVIMTFFIEKPFLRVRARICR